MRVLVTGGLGFIGSHIVDELVTRGHEVICIDSLSPAAHACEPDYVNPDVEYHRIWLSDVDAVARIAAGVDAVSHQAARVGLGQNFADVTAYVSDNSLGTAVLFRALHQVGFTGRVVQASSMVVYGEGGYTCAEHGRVRPAARAIADLRAGRFEPGCPRCAAPLAPVSVDEGDPVDPRNVYAATKLNQEHLGAAFASVTGCDLVSLRYHNVYGPRMPRDTPYAGVASIVRSACEAGLAPRVFEDGQQRRDFVHVSDVALANVLALTAAEPIAGAYNIASNHVCTISRMAEAVCSAAGTTLLRPRVTGEFRIGDVRHITARADRALERFGFRASVDPDSGLRHFATEPLRPSLARA